MTGTENLFFHHYSWVAVYLFDLQWAEMYLKIREYRAVTQEAKLSAFATSNNRCEELKNIELQVTRN